MGNSTHTDTMKAAAYEITTTPTKQNACKDRKYKSTKQTVRGNV